MPLGPPQPHVPTNPEYPPGDPPSGAPALIFTTIHPLHYMELDTERVAAPGIQPQEHIFVDVQKR